MRRGWFLLVLLAGCGGKSGATPCAGAGTDLDGDAYGPGCPAGPDCDDMDPLHHDDCSACDTGPAPGCPCAVGAPSVSCFDGTAAQAGTPPCMKGIRSCDPVSQTWGACAGQVAPAPEYCDTVDNDCDGVVDDGVLSMCGDCTPGCDQVVVGDGTPFPFPGDPLPPNVQSIDVDGVGLDPSGDLVLDAQNIEFHFLWVANAGEGTVSKLDTRTGREVARYASVAHAALVDVMGVGGANVPAWGGANSPSRTAVDFYGNVWVGNRAPYDAAYPAGLQPTATKIYNSTSDCVDRNGNGLIDTSNDASGDGRIDLADPAEFFAEADECIAFTVIVGAPDDAVDEYGVRAVAIDRGIDPGEPGNAWVGLFSEQAFYQLSGRDGTLVRRVPATGNFQSEVGAPVSPYGAAIDGNGMLWTTNGCCGNNGVLQINTVSGAIVGNRFTEVGVTCAGQYGIAIDLANRLWLGGWPCASALRYDPATTIWTEVQIPGYFGAGWGVRGIGADAIGNVWVAMHLASPFSDGVLARVDTNTATATGAWDIGGEVPVGAAVDFDGDVWTVNQSSSTASRLHLDPVTHEPAAHPMTSNMVDPFPVGYAPYTYSDFTGLGLRTITRPTGDYTVVYEGCADMTQADWTQVVFDATTPAGTSVEVWARAGDDLATLAAQPLYGPWITSPADLQVFPGPVPRSRYLELTLRLISLDRTSTPIVHSYQLQWTCPTIPIPSLIPGLLQSLP